MGRSLAVAALALVGLLCAAGIGLAAYVVSRDSVAVPVTKLQPRPGGLTPARARRTTTATPRTTPTTRTGTVDDGGGGGGRGGGGGDNSGHGGGGHGSDD